MRLLLKNIKELLQVRNNFIPFVAGEQLSELPSIKNAYLLIEDDLISDFGPMDLCPDHKVDKVVDATGKMVLPTWCDSHTHLVFPETRVGEFVDRINGLSYEQIAQKGGGILNSAKKMQTITDEELYLHSEKRLKDLIQLGTGAIEIKSGYGLETNAELKMLRVIKRLKENSPVEIKATFLGAHALPLDYKNDKSGYLKMLVEIVMPKIAEESLAEYIDIFCETGYFDIEDTNYILEAGQKYGLIPKIHVNQFTIIGGVQTAVKFKALSVDHLEELNEKDIQSLKNTSTMPVALPGCSFFLGIPYTPARQIIDAGLPIALASDYNPGSAPSGNMNFIVSLACVKMKMNPNEAINAATLNGAYAMGLENQLGSITVGKLANIIVTKPIDSHEELPYSFGENLIDQVYIKGNLVK
ncbi:MAG: imidazolonepropionase [Calditrichaeota bacterium]|nr:MAG: imidazolonepropionase [Calditrichota bacterium]MBL1206377.1 imidazolonepropionase [Calditrichota bacterium]NOG46203.1 imidazolonepropionase [Calditrichota bacterium]